LSFFHCYSSSIEDLNIEVQDINQFIVRQHSFTTRLNQTDFEALKDASRSLVPFSMTGGDVRYGWIHEVSYNYVEGLANIKLLSKTVTE
jgi:hypothetical protein